MNCKRLWGGLTLFLYLCSAGCNAPDPGIGQACAREDAPAMRTLDLSATSGEIADHLKSKEVVITLDDGPHMFRTKPVLDTLDQYCLKATFFLQGRNSQRHPQIVRDIVARGHTLGSHTFDHLNLTEMEIDQALAEIKRGNDPIHQALMAEPDAVPITLFRFPFVATTPELSAAISQSGYREIPVHADGADWTRNTPAESTARIMDTLNQRDQRGIILLHDPFRRSDQRLDDLIDALIGDGYTFVHLVEAG